MFFLECMCAPEIWNFSQINDVNKRFLQCLEISIFCQIPGPHMHSRNKDKARKVRFAQVEKCASRTFTRPLTVLQTNPGIGAISSVNLELFLRNPNCSPFTGILTPLLSLFPENIFFWRMHVGSRNLKSHSDKWGWTTDSWNASKS